MEGHMVGFTVTVDFHVKPRAQRIHHGGADTMQTAGGIVG